MPYFLLKEDADFLLQESGDKIILDSNTLVTNTKSLRYSIKVSTKVTKALKYSVNLGSTAITKSGKYCILTTPKNGLATQYLLKEDGDFLLQENGDKIIIDALTRNQKPLTYKIYFYCVKQKSLKYTVLTSTSTTKSLKYSVVAAKLNTESLKYCITVANTPLTYSMRYDIYVTGWTPNPAYISNWAKPSDVTSGWTKKS